MARQPEQEREPSDKSEANEGATQPQTSRLRSWTGCAWHFVRRGFAPVISVVALAAAVASSSTNQSIQVQLRDQAAKVNGMNAGQAAAKSDLEKLKASLAQEKAALEEERKKLDERQVKIIQAVTRLQVKAKISPTLEEQLRQPDNVSVAKPAAPGTSAAAAPVPGAATAPAAAKKQTPQVKAMMDAIEQYNKQ